MWCELTQLTFLTCRASAEASVAELRCGYLDLLLMHWPDAWQPGTEKEPDTSVTIRQTW